MTSEITVFLIDDDPDVRQALSWLLRAHRFCVATFASVADFLTAVTPQARGVIVMDLRMPEIDGLDGQALLRQRGFQLPILFLTAHGDVPSAVVALKQGAFDFLEKPVEGQALVARIQEALAFEAKLWSERQREAQWTDGLAKLTEREREVLRLTLQGLPTKTIADRLGIAVRTVEVHRGHLFEKLGVKSALELAAQMPPHLRAEIEAS